MLLLKQLMNQSSSEMSTLPLQLQTHRLQMNLTQRELSAKAGVAYSTLRKLEATGTGSMTDFVKLLKALQMRAQLAVLGLDDETTAEQPRTLRRRARKRPAEVAPVQQHSPRSDPSSFGLKSQRLGLSFPYDWSNPHIEDAVLIAKVLDKARFDDVSRTTAYFGLTQIEQVAQRFGIALDSGPLGAILPAIRQAQSAHTQAAA
jgi:transcriptional regulator with XRE-family HTH domain